MSGILDLDLNALTDPNEIAPDGTYDLRIKEATDITADSGAKYIKLQIQIIGDGKQSGKTFFENVVYKNKDGATNTFGAWKLKQLFTLAKAKKADPALLNGLEFRAEVGHDEAQGDFGAQNKTKRILM